ncbi:MAG: hypothetical protein PHI90_06305 [Clostridia bacterium]|nr:hypothetical protein [Clostridia bacterium]
MSNQNKSKENKKMITILKRPCTPTESLEQSLKEMKQMRIGKLPKKSWRNMFKEIKEEKRD